MAPSLPSPSAAEMLPLHQTHCDLLGSHWLGEQAHCVHQPIRGQRVNNRSAWQAVKMPQLGPAQSHGLMSEGS